MLGGPSPFSATPSDLCLPPLWLVRLPGLPSAGIWPGLFCRVAPQGLPRVFLGVPSLLDGPPVTAPAQLFCSPGKGSDLVQVMWHWCWHHVVCRLLGLLPGLVAELELIPKGPGQAWCLRPKGPRRAICSMEMFFFQQPSVWGLGRAFPTPWLPFPGQGGVPRPPVLGGHLATLSGPSPAELVSQLGTRASEGLPPGAFEGTTGQHRLWPCVHTQVRGYLSLESSGAGGVTGWKQREGKEEHKMRKAVVPWFTEGKSRPAGPGLCLGRSEPRRPWESRLGAWPVGQ